MKVKEILKEKGITAKDLAGKVGMSEVGLSVALSEKGNPSLNTLKKIAEALDVELPELFSPNEPVFGVIILNGKTYQIESFEQLERMYADYLELKNKTY